MKLWTIQPEEVWTELKIKGKFMCNPNKAVYIQEYPKFKQAYNWMVEQMHNRIRASRCGQVYPIWAWHVYDGRNHQPDLRQSGYDKKGTMCVCLEIDIKDNRVILSDFDAWHSVLNDRVFDSSRSEEDSDNFHCWYDRLSAEEQYAIKLESWQKIFDTKYFENDWACTGKYVQATFWELFIGDIKSVKHFRAR